MTAGKSDRMDSPGFKSVSVITPDNITAFTTASLSVFYGSTGVNHPVLPFKRLPQLKEKSASGDFFVSIHVLVFLCLSPFVFCTDNLLVCWV